jgi:hypothetical protein
MLGLNPWFVLGIIVVVVIGLALVAMLYVNAERSGGNGNDRET